MTESIRKPVYLKDYQPPDFKILQTELIFDIFEKYTRVQSILRIQRTQKGKQGPLILNGERLKLISARLNDKTLSNKEYQLTPTHLTIFAVDDDFKLEIETEIDPHHNTSLEGLYRSGDILCTQNESEGFRKITYYLDRPDVMAKFKTTIKADRRQYPVLLSNGNPIASGELPKGRHYVTWEDPFPKPCYLFALVAGDLACVSDSYTTKSGRNIDLRMYVDKGNESKTTFALESLKKAMKWDEETFGLECDLDTYMIVAVGAFNFGAMENKGLNIFNSQYALANPETATDANYEAILSVIGHEYFHNWTGNRVTCRDWFQITLKEGLTIFRDEEFSADMASRPVKRIADVRIIRDHQFVEDSGPNAHPIRPESYLEINNFYTTTVYQKGSEVIRMIQTLIGSDAFRRGMAKYFELFDGQAVTTDDFVKAMEIASGMDLTQFKLWYKQAGTPLCTVQSAYDPARRTYMLTVEQKPPRNVAPDKIKPYYFPLAVGLLDSQGKNLPLQLDGETNPKMQDTKILHISKAKQVFVFREISHRPVPSLLQNFSAPVILEYDYTPEELIFLLAHDRDDFNRYDAGQRIFTLWLKRLIHAIQEELPLPDDLEILEAAGHLIRQEDLDPAFKAEALILPSLTSLIEGMDICDFDAAFQAREWLLRRMASAYEKDFIQLYESHQTPGPYSPEPEAMGKRSLKNRALAYLTSLEKSEYTALAFKQFQSAENMTDSIAALGVLCQLNVPERKEALDQFANRWRHDPLVMNKWFAVQAGSKLKVVLEEVQGLEKDPSFDMKNPNKVRALFGVFGQNVVSFHEASGSGYTYMADKILAIDRLNPSAAAHLTEAFHKFGQLDAGRRTKMAVELDRILATQNLSPHVFEIASKTRSAAEAPLPKA